MRRLVFLVPLFLSILPATGCSGRGDAEAPPATPPEKAVPVRLLAVAPQAVVDVLVLSADLLPERRATLAAEVPGTIEEMRVELGERVAAGELLVQIDTRALRQGLAEAEAVYRQAEDRSQRAQRLFERRSITEQGRIDAVAQREVAAARLASARLALAKSEVKAPWAGQVAARRVEVGDYAAPGQPLLELVAVDRLKVRGAAAAADVPFLRLGAPVEVRVDVLPGEVFTGRVVRLGAELDPSTRTLDVEAELPNADGRLRPGMFGRLEIPRRNLPEALLVPLDAVVDYEREHVVYVVEQARALRRVVELGPLVGEQVVVESGLTAGERVVVDGQRMIADGQLVDVAGGA